jgi:hypothetical protein
MCEYCDREVGRGLAQTMIERLDRLSSFYEAIRDGRIKPHTEETKSVTSTANHVIRQLVEEWV